MRFAKLRKFKELLREKLKIPFGVKIAICVFPVFITALFYVLRFNTGVMDWVVKYISAPVRNFFGLLSSIYPFAIMEVICTAAVVFLIYYIIKSIRDTSRRRGKWKLLGKRVLPILVVACYLWGAFCWLWNSGYHATGFAERYEFSNEGVAIEDVVIVAQFFALKTNELSELMERDDEGNYIADRRTMFADSTGIYRNISREFPSLQGRLYAPKPMMYSWLMSITRYSGMYFALTGEAMINTHPPGTFMPFTVAHEHAHQLGIFAEDEANFVGIAACVTSGNPVFEYAGYLSGLGYLMNALPVDDLIEILDNMNYFVKLDRFENAVFWSTRTTANTGINFLDRFLTTVAETTSDAVNTIYDTFLKSQNQELGLQSYGACVDLLVEYFLSDALEYMTIP
jgi:hypothetical protein